MLKDCHQVIVYLGLPGGHWRLRWAIINEDFHSSFSREPTEKWWLCAFANQQNFVASACCQWVAMLWYAGFLQNKSPRVLLLKFCLWVACSETGLTHFARNLRKKLEKPWESLNLQNWCIADGHCMVILSYECHKLVMALPLISWLFGEKWCILFRGPSFWSAKAAMGRKGAPAQEGMSMKVSQAWNLKGLEWLESDSVKSAWSVFDGKSFYCLGILMSFRLTSLILIGLLG